MSDRLLLATTTGERFQPARLHYSVRDRRRLEACFRKLRCMGFDDDRNRWVWHYDDEARSLMVSDRLGLSGSDELLAPKLEPAAGWSDEPGEPIERLWNEEIRQAILHSEPAVHRAAMWYFAGADSRDPGIAPLVIESMQAMKDDRHRTFACV